MDKGVYCLVFRNPACTVHVGALGAVSFSAGWHTYVGSALGSGGLKRLERHTALSRDRNRRPKWHVDYLLINQHFQLSYTVSAPTTKRLECPLARAFGMNGNVPGFGCSDCRCQSHLLYRNHEPQEEIIGAFRKLSLDPTIKTIMSRETKPNV